MTKRVLSTYHRQMYAGGNVVIAAAGNVEHNKLMRMLQRAQSQQRPRPAARASGGRSSRRRRPGVRFAKKDTEQYHVCVGAPGIARSDRRRFAASILDSILGGSASSRLFQEIREKRGMAYSVYSLRVAVHRHGPGRHLHRDARGEPRRSASRSPARELADIAGGQPPSG